MPSLYHIQSVRLRSGPADTRKNLNSMCLASGPSHARIFRLSYFVRLAMYRKDHMSAYLYSVKSKNYRAFIKFCLLKGLCLSVCLFV